MGTNDRIYLTHHRPETLEKRGLELICLERAEGLRALIAEAGILPPSVAEFFSANEKEKDLNGARIRSFLNKKGKSASLPIGAYTAITSGINRLYMRLSPKQIEGIRAIPHREMDGFIYITTQSIWGTRKQFKRILDGETVMVRRDVWERF